MRLWIVRAGRQGERELDALSQGKIMLGFAKVGDLTPMKDREAILSHMGEAFLSARDNARKNFAPQRNQFVNVIQKGDPVVLPRKLTNGLAIGRCLPSGRMGPNRHFRKGALLHLGSRLGCLPAGSAARSD